MKKYTIFLVLSLLSNNGFAQLKTKKDIQNYYVGRAQYSDNPIDAISMLKKGLTGDQVLDGEVLFLIAIQKEILGDLRGAIIEYSQIINIFLKAENPNKPKIISGSAYYYLESRAIIAYVNRYKAKERLKDYQGAMEDLITLLNMYKNRPSIREYSNKIGFLKIKLEDYKNAILYFNETIELGSEDEAESQARFGKGICLIKIGEIDKGCIELSKSGDLGYKLAYDTIQKLCN